MAYLLQWRCNLCTLIVRPLIDCFSISSSALCHSLHRILHWTEFRWSCGLLLFMALLWEFQIWRPASAIQICPGLGLIALVHGRRLLSHTAASAIVRVASRRTATLNHRHLRLPFGEIGPPGERAMREPGGLNCGPSRDKRALQRCEVLSWWFHSLWISLEYVMVSFFSFFCTYSWSAKCTLVKSYCPRFSFKWWCGPDSGSSAYRGLDMPPVNVSFLAENCRGYTPRIEHTSFLFWSRIVVCACLFLLLGNDRDEFFKTNGLCVSAHCF